MAILTGITFFLLDKQSEDLLKAVKSQLKFIHELQGCLTIEIDTPEGAIAYPENVVLQYFDTHKLNVGEGVYYGSWSGREPHVDFQDIIVAGK